MPRTETRPDAVARAILACPAGVTIVVDGVDDVLDDVRGPDALGELGLQDLAGVPTFTCPTGTRLPRAARERRRALVTLESGLGPAASRDRAMVLTLGGRLEARGRQSCECCAESRESVALVVDLVVVTRTDDAGEQQARVPVELFGAPEHLLNRGFLQRTTDHANQCHQLELRRAVATTTGQRLGEVIGVSLTQLSGTGVDVQWVGPDGSHVHHLDFPRTADTPEQLGELLRSELHAGLC